MLYSPQDNQGDNTNWRDDKNKPGQGAQPDTAQKDWQKGQKGPGNAEEGIENTDTKGKPDELKR